MSLDAGLARMGRKLRRISNVELPRANARALNDSSKLGRTRIVRGVARETRLKSKQIRERIYLARATAKKQRARITVYTRDVSAISQFSPAQRARLQDGKGTSKRGVRVAGRTERSAFVARGRNNKRQVFRREGKARKPIEAIKYPIQEPAVRITMKVSRRVMKTEYPRVLGRELNYRINRVANT